MGRSRRIRDRSSLPRVGFHNDSPLANAQTTIVIRDVGPLMPIFVFGDVLFDWRHFYKVAQIVGAGYQCLVKVLDRLRCVVSDATSRSLLTLESVRHERKCAQASAGAGKNGISDRGREGQKRSLPGSRRRNVLAIYEYRLDFGYIPEAR